MLANKFVVFASFLVLVLTIPAIVAGGAETSKKNTRQQTQKDNQNIGPEFDMDQLLLKAGFKGNNFISLYRSLCIPPKGEFETTDQYETRKRTVRRRIHAFVLPKPSVKYKPDDQEFIVSFNMASAHTGKGHEYDSSMLLLKESGRETGKYVGKNAFGVARVVTRRVEHKWGIFLRGTSPRQIDLRVPVSIEDARRLGNTLAVLAIVRTGSESIPDRIDPKSHPDGTDATGYDVSGATIDVPIDLKIYYHTIQAEIPCLWVYDNRSGRVLSKFNVYGRPGCEYLEEKTSND